VKQSRKQRKQPTAVVMVEICRSFAYKLNVGNYESRDFFTSYKIQVPKQDEREASQSAYEFCEEEVLNAVKKYRAKMALQRGEAA
jgi:hypothetical protein